MLHYPVFKKKPTARYNFSKQCNAFFWSSKDRKNSLDKQKDTAVLFLAFHTQDEGNLFLNI